MRSFFEGFFLRPHRGEPLAALRIVLGLAMLTEAARVYPYLGDLYGQYGLFQADLMERLTGAALPGWLLKLGMGPESFLPLLRGFFLAYLASAVFFTLGLFTRTATVLVWLSQMILVNCGAFSSYGVDRYFVNFAFLMIFFPAGNVWSLDRLRARRPAEALAACRIGLRLLQLFLLIAYVDAGLSKAHGADWWSGEALWRALNQPEFRRADFLWLAAVPWLPRILGVGTFLAEALYCVGVWIPRLGVLWVLAMIGMHLGIAAFMGLTLFGCTLAAANAALFLVPGSRTLK